MKSTKLCQKWHFFSHFFCIFTNLRHLSLANHQFSRSKPLSINFCSHFLSKGAKIQKILFKFRRKTQNLENFLFCSYHIIFPFFIIKPSDLRCKRFSQSLSWLYFSLTPYLCPLWHSCSCKRTTNSIFRCRNNACNFLNSQKFPI